jgi:hypothetical protein
MSYIGCMGYIGSGNVRGLRKLFWTVVRNTRNMSGLQEQRMWFFAVFEGMVAGLA